MPSKIYSCSLQGIDGVVIEVEVDISFGLPVFHMVGLPEVSVKESKDRVKAAVNNCGYTFPMDRVVVNLAPADMKKQGSGFDLPVALGILAASGLLPENCSAGFLAVGELSLDGRVKPVKSAVSYTLCARKNGFKSIAVPKENALEAAMVKGIDILPVDTLGRIADHLSGVNPIQPFRMDEQDFIGSRDNAPDVDFCEVKGQHLAKRALEIASAGFHNVLMSGPPGSGKSMLAKRLPTILPDLTFEQSLDVTRIHSAAGLIDPGKPKLLKRPFRSPHHTISDAGLVGGGSKPMPGEISLAHHGVLFLDELPEFKKNVLEVLRQPLEDGKVRIARAGETQQYPSRFMLVAAQNPCPCGFLSDPSGKCSCTAPQIRKYQSKISGPLMDRIDIQVEVPRIEYKELTSDREPETSHQIRKRVMAARAIQEDRFAKTSVRHNALMGNRHLDRFCPLDKDCEKLLEQAVDILGFSARACHSVVRVARTIADLEASSHIKRPHLAEAVQLRSFDRRPGTDR